MVRSRIAVFEHMRDIVFGTAEGKNHERGWLSGGYAQTSSHGKVRTCLNSALFASERDIIVGDGTGAHRVSSNSEETGGLRTTEGRDTQRELALAILSEYPQLLDGTGEYIRMTADEDEDGWLGKAEALLKKQPGLAHGVIVGFNDHTLTSGLQAAKEMDRILGIAEKRMWDKWYLDHPEYKRPNWKADDKVYGSFVEYAKS